jgi:YD repeat-containing protein
VLTGIYTIIGGLLAVVVTGDEQYYGDYSAQAGAINDGEASTLEVALNCQEGNISFYRKVSSESGFDYLSFYIDDVQKGSWSGEQGWTQVSYAVGPGTHTFKWIYSKDEECCPGGSDTAWIDYVQFPPLTSNMHNLEYVYDANDDLVVRNYYDTAEDRVYQQDVGDGFYEFEHDPASSTTTIIDREGYEIDMVYNEDGQLINRTVYTKDPQAEPNSFTISYDYDPNTRQRTLVTYPSSNCTAYTYDDLGNLAGKYFKANPSEPNDINDPNVIAELYTYDVNFPHKIKTITDPMGNVTTYDYNGITGNLDKITFPTITTDQGQQTPIQTYTYDEFGQIETVTTPDGVVTKY